MRIAQLAPLAESVPPKLYGGTERVVSWLTEELVSMGCEVTLFASGDFLRNRVLDAGLWPCPAIEPATGRSVCCLRDATRSIGQRGRRIRRDPLPFRLDSFPALTRLGMPFLTTMHGRLDLPDFPDFPSSFFAPLVSISDSQREPMPPSTGATIHHGMPPELPRPSGRRAISHFWAASRRKRAPMSRSASHVRQDFRCEWRPRYRGRGSRFFKEQIGPLIDGAQVEFIGEVGEREKTEFLGRATALLFPIDWPEPFGLVMIEAMACGTPVVAWRCGSVPEIVEDGVTGFVVNTEADAVEALGQVGRLDRQRNRQTFERRFAARRMAEDYVRCYQRVAQASHSGRG